MANTYAKTLCFSLERKRTFNFKDEINILLILFVNLYGSVAVLFGLLCQFFEFVGCKCIAKVINIFHKKSSKHPDHCTKNTPSFDCKTMKYEK